MTLQTITVAGLSTSYADAQAGDLIPVERAGVMGKQTRAEFQTGLALGTMSAQAADAVNIDGGAIDGTVIGGTTPAVATFTTINAATARPDFISMSAAATEIRMLAQNTASTHNVQSIVNSAGETTFRTLNSAGSIVTNDYVMAKGASGVTQHSWRITGTEVLRIDSGTLRTQGIRPLATGWNIGADAGGGNIVRYATIFLENAPNVSSDARLKENIADLTEAEKRAAAKIKARTFTMKGQKKVGYIAQEVIEAMDSEGLCAFEYGLVTDGETYGVDMDAINAFRLG